MQAHSFAAPILKEFVKGAKETHDTYETGHVVLLEPASKTLEKHIGVDLNDLEQVKDLLTGIQKTKNSEEWIKVITAVSEAGELKELLSLCPFLLHQTLDIAPEVSHLLISAGADVNNKNAKGETPLCLAVNTAPFAIVEAMLKAGAEVHASSAPRDVFPVLQAVCRTDFDIFKLLLDNGADLTVSNKQGLRAIDLAIFRLHKNSRFVTKVWHYFSKEEKRRMDLKHMMGFVIDLEALNLVIQLFGEDSVRELIAEEEILKESVRRGCDSVEFLLFLLDIVGLSIPDVLYPHGNTLLHIAAQKGSSKLIDWLLENYPSLLLMKNSKGESALALAMKQGGLSNPTALYLANKEIAAIGVTSVKMEKTRKQLRKEAVKARPKSSHGFDLCNFVASGRECPYGAACKQPHDIEKYMEGKQKLLGQAITTSVSGELRCVFFKANGYCPYGLKCIFSDEHSENNQNTGKETPREGRLLKEDNYLKKKIQRKLRKKTYNFKITESAQDDTNDGDENCCEGDSSTEEENSSETEAVLQTTDDEKMCSVPDEDKKPIDWRNKLVLAPLTTVGNLPFRRLCVTLGADVTVSEMAVAGNLVKGNSGEWALVRRHPSESIFGAQVCGNNSDVMSKCAQLLSTHNIDFIDINVGCPIDYICNQGMGSALLGHLTKLKGIVKATVRAANTVPVTVKMRMGLDEKKPLVLVRFCSGPKANFSQDKIAPVVQEWGASAITLHGRSRAQRYRNQANWDYIDEVGKLCRSKGLPIIGNGDVFNHKEAQYHFDNRNVDALMIARGALIKPWIFQEIKDHRAWDISASERFDLLKKYVDFGLEHWGSDLRGVENTRYFFLNWCSFLCRYIPIGILERYPLKIYESAPKCGFYGRNDLETLMGSPEIKDWIKLSEMLLGPITDTERFKDFSAKHKAKG